MSNFRGPLHSSGSTSPKGTDLSVHSAAHVAAVMAELNNRPRKTLDYSTPAARFRTEAGAAVTPQ